MEITFWGTDKQ